jgi:hypothetical protein
LVDPYDEDCLSLEPAIPRPISSGIDSRCPPAPVLRNFTGSTFIYHEKRLLRASWSWFFHGNGPLHYSGNLSFPNRLVFPKAFWPSSLYFRLSMKKHYCKPKPFVWYDPSKKGQNERFLITILKNTIWSFTYSLWNQLTA